MMRQAPLYPSHRPVVMATRAAVASSHYLASVAGQRILDQGGNVVDAGVAMGLCINVLQPHMTSLGGVAPIILHLAGEERTVVIDGLGVWPRAASIDLFRERYGDLPEGIMRSVVPAAADAWLTALEQFGTLPFAQVAAPAIELAERGFPMYGSLHSDLTGDTAGFRRWPSTAAVLLPGDRVPALGERVIQADLASTLRRMVEAEDRGGIPAARDLFYRGDIARQMAEFAQAQGGLLTYDDLASFHVSVEEPVLSRYRDVTVATCGPWCQGPVINQTLNILNHFEPATMDHNSADYVHLLAEALKLAFADRERYYGDPRFVEVPLDGLLSEDYARVRAADIDMARAWPEMPPPGDPRGFGASSARGTTPVDTAPGPWPYDTAYLCVADSEGNLFSATPSDSARETPMVPGLGLVISPRGTQSWLDPQHPSSLQPGKRPRLTPNPALAFRGGRPWLTFGTPGGDMQCQAMVQLLVNLIDFDMDPQQAIEAPRFSTESFPNSFWPHTYRPGILTVENRIGDEVRAELAGRGHRVAVWPAYARAASSLCAILLDPETGTLMAGADPRRENYALGW
ncbi:MAG: gamma-glutamyltransferase family protein [Anaerolineae bacterium]